MLQGVFSARKRIVDTKTVDIYPHFRYTVTEYKLRRIIMLTRKEAIEYCLTFNGVYEDYPFDDANWTVMRRRDTKRGFAWIFERQGHIWINLKADPGWGDFYRQQYASVIPAYHMNKLHWNSVILDGSVPENEIRQMITDSYALCGKK